MGLITDYSSLPTIIQFLFPLIILIGSVLVFVFGFNRAPKEPKFSKLKGESKAATLKKKKTSKDKEPADKPKNNSPAKPKSPDTKTAKKSTATKTKKVGKENRNANEDDEVLGNALLHNKTKKGKSATLTVSNAKQPKKESNSAKKKSPVVDKPKKVKSSNKGNDDGEGDWQEAKPRRRKVARD